jgi:antitoxin ParD1/3/4
MDVKLTPELEELIRRKVSSGLYSNNSEVVSEALRLLAEQDRLREAHAGELRTALAEGLAQAERDETADGPTFVADVRQRLRERSQPDTDGE